MNKKKHIVFLTEHMSLGGAEVVLAEYLNSIDPETYQVSLIVRDDLGAKNYNLEKVDKNVTVKTIFSEQSLKGYEPISGKSLSAKLENRRRKKAFKKNIVSGFQKALKELNPDVVVDFSPVLIRYLRNFKEYRIILWMHGQKIHMPKWERLKYLIRIRKYDKIVLICDEMKQQFIELFPSVQNKFDVIYNPFDIDRIRRAAEDVSQVTAPDEEFMQKKYVLSLARLVPGKDFATVIEAARILKERGFLYTHYIVGSGELMESLQQKVLEYGLQEQVFLLGARKNPYVWLKNAEVFVHSAFREGLPTVIIEAMVLDTPVIACTCPTGPREILENGKSGALYSVQDAKLLADLIEELLTKPEAQTAYLTRARVRVFDFHKSKIMPKFYALIESLARNN